MQEQNAGEATTIFKKYAKNIGLNKRVYDSGLDLGNIQTPVTMISMLLHL